MHDGKPIVPYAQPTRSSVKPRLLASTVTIPAREEWSTSAHDLLKLLDNGHDLRIIRVLLHGAWTVGYSNESRCIGAWG